MRIRTDAAGAEAARGIQARAYILGERVVFGAGEYAPTTNAGRHLLAHELTYVVQQRGGSGTLARRAAAPHVSAGQTIIQRDVAKIAESDDKARGLIDIATRTRGSKSSNAVELV